MLCDAVTKIKSPRKMQRLSPEVVHITINAIAIGGNGWPGHTFVNVVKHAIPVYKVT